MVRFFQKNLIVFAECHTEDDGGDIFETVNPFLALASLPAHVEHAKLRQNPYSGHIGDRLYLLYAELAHSKPGFINARCFRPGTEDVGLIRYVVGRRQSLNFLKETGPVSIMEIKWTQANYYGAESII